MKYKIQVDFIHGGIQVTHYPDLDENSFFDHPGNPVDACNYRIFQILKNGESEINSSNLVGARIYVEGEQVLEVNYRKNKLNLTTKIENFWIDI